MCVHTPAGAGAVRPDPHMPLGNTPGLAGARAAPDLRLRYAEGQTSSPSTPAVSPARPSSPAVSFGRGAGPARAPSVGGCPRRANSRELDDLYVSTGEFLLSAPAPARPRRRATHRIRPRALEAISVTA
jgi:hypothetical protein